MWIEFYNDKKWEITKNAFFNTLLCTVFFCTFPLALGTLALVIKYMMFSATSKTISEEMIWYILIIDFFEK